MFISHAIRYLLIASLIVSMPTHPMGSSFSTKAKIGIGVAAALAAFVGYQAWTHYKNRASQEARRRAKVTIEEMRIVDYKGVNKFDLQAAHTAQLFNSINHLGWLINGENLDELLLDRVKILLKDPIKSALENSGENLGQIIYEDKIVLGGIKSLLEYSEVYCASPDMTYQDLKPKLTYSIPDLSSSAARTRGDEMPLEERPITLLAKKLMSVSERYLSEQHGCSRIQLIQLIHGYSKLPLDVTDHEGNIRSIMYSDSDDRDLIASLNQRRQSRRDVIHDATPFSDILSDLVFCYDDPLMEKHPISLKSGNAVLASWPKQLTHDVDSDSNDEKEQEDYI